MLYTIYASELVYVFDQFQVSRASCPVTYSLTVSGLDPTDVEKTDTEDRYIVTFDSDTRSISVQTDNNLFGDKEITLVLTATNSKDISHSETFKLTTSKDCQYATLTVDSAFELDYEYQIDSTTSTDTAISFLGVVTTDDQNCELSYEVRYNDDDTPLATSTDGSGYWLTNDGTTDIIINTNDNNNEKTASPLQLKIVVSDIDN